MLLAVACAWGCTSPVQAQEQSVSPGINRHYQDAKFEHWLNVFESRGREVYDRRKDIVAALDLRPGMSIADVGAGTGFFTLMFAENVGPSGRVYAIDISEDFVDSIRRRAGEQGLDNITAIVNTPQDVLLPSGSIDVAFLCDTYHHFEYPQAMLASIHQALRPGGELVVIDFRKRHGASSNWIMSHVRANENAVVSEIESAGFRLKSRSDFLHSNYFIHFVKLDS